MPNALLTRGGEWLSGMTEEKPEKTKRIYDLEERTARFGEAVIAFSKNIPGTAITEPIITQLIKAATSVGANYCEADDAVSKREFRKFIGICRRESRESKHWLRMIATAEPALKGRARQLWQEAKELHLIFAKTFKSATENPNKGK